MKKFKGTKYAHIGTSYTPLLDAEIAKLESAVLNQQARRVVITERVEDLLGTDLEHWGE